jgi:MoxR-like ATPase
MSQPQTEFSRRLALAAEQLTRLRAALAQVIVGQQEVVDQTLVALLAGGHVLLEGAPGLGKTLLVRTLAGCVDLTFSRVQFTPDLTPADILGGEILVDRADGRRDFVLRRGPIFCQILLADEINRAPAKVQSALLEAMQERQVTIGDTSYPLPKPFIVMAT